MTKKLLFIALMTILVLNPTLPQVQPESTEVSKSSLKVLAQKEISLDYRYPVKSVSEVFKDNILLNLAYLTGSVKSAKNIDWSNLEKNNQYTLTLQPNETFAYHESVLKEFEGKVSKTTNSHFGQSDGYKSDGYLYGDGVCHLASLMNLVARQANLDVKSPTNHDFANIPEIPKEYGVSIYFHPGKKYASEVQNLYITNNQDKPITFIFDYVDGSLSLKLVS